jgi:hypothetical protein
MKIYTRISFQWDGEKYARVEEESFEYNGPVAFCCGATSAQKQQASTTSSAYQTAINNAQSVFGASSSVFQTLKNTFAPIVAAGPSQNGFSGQTLSNLNSSAITQTGQEAKNEKAAVGNAEATVGGGTSVLPSGGQVGSDLSIAENAGNQTSSELSNIQLANEKQGNENYNNATKGLEAATGVYSPATGATEAATSSGNTAGNAANSVAQANQSTWQLAAGALGGVAGAALGGGGLSSLLSLGSNTQGPGVAGLQTAQQISQVGSSGLSPTSPTVTAGV